MEIKVTSCADCPFAEIDDECSKWCVGFGMGKTKRKTFADRFKKSSPRRRIRLSGIPKTKAMRHIRNYIKEHGIMCWLQIRENVKRQYGNNSRILYRNNHLTFYDFECAMMEWYYL